MYFGACATVEMRPRHQGGGLDEADASCPAIEVEGAVREDPAEALRLQGGLPTFLYRING